MLQNWKRPTFSNWPFTICMHCVVKISWDRTRKVRMRKNLRLDSVTVRPRWARFWVFWIKTHRCKWSNIWPHAWIISKMLTHQHRPSVFRPRNQTKWIVHDQMYKSKHQFKSTQLVVIHKCDSTMHRRQIIWEFPHRRRHHHHRSSSSHQHHNQWQPFSNSRNSNRKKFWWHFSSSKTNAVNTMIWHKFTRRQCHQRSMLTIRLFGDHGKARMTHRQNGHNWKIIRKVWEQKPCSPLTKLWLHIDSNDMWCVRNPSECTCVRVRRRRRRCVNYIYRYEYQSYAHKYININE